MPTPAVDLPGTVADLPTPCFLVNVDRVQSNADRMIKQCQQLGIKLRPHMKTAKTIEAGVLATGGSRRSICVSTLSEAEFYADAGFDDIIYAMLLSVSKMPRLRALNKKLESLHVLVDNPQHVQMLQADTLQHGKAWSVYLAVDTGSAREGVVWNDKGIVEIAKSIYLSDDLKFCGLYTHEGNASFHVLGDSNVKQVANTTADRVLHVAEILKSEGVKCSVVSIGATPTASLPGDHVKNITEIHPGNYIFYDAQQEHIGSCSEADIACQIATRVIGQYPHRNQLLVDAGWSAVSLDGKLPNGSYGTFYNQPHLRLVQMHQEYGFVAYDPNQHTVDDFPIGTMLYLNPYHSCATALMHKQYYTIRNKEITGTWVPCSQW